MSVSDTTAPAERSWRATSIYYTQQVTIIGLVVLTIASAPYWPFANDYVIGMIVRVLLFIALGQAWNVAAGIGGQLSLGHGVFFGIGAYVTALLFNDFGVTPWLGGLVSVTASVVVALVMSLTTVRLRGVYFALGTIVISLGFEKLTRYAAGITGGDTGLLVQFLGDAPAVMQWRTPVPFLWLSLAVVTVFYLLTRRLLRCRFGLAMQAVRDDEDAATAAGIDVRRTKLLGLLMSAAMTALVGTVYVQFYMTIDPATAFGLFQAIQIQLPSLIGGLGTAAGPVIGGALMVLAGEGTNAISTKLGTNGLDVLVYGLMLLAVVMRAPDGLLRMFAGLGNRGIGNGGTR
jgi:branched-chain amino acid transport system permease protein